jgi:hypothetical protein
MMFDLLATDTNVISLWYLLVNTAQAAGRFQELLIVEC